MTWNAGGKNPHKDTIEDLKNEIFSDHNDPDIIIFSLQEARPSLNNKENIAERVLKRCKDENGKEAYAVCHSSKIDVFIYHERYVATQPNHRETCLVIAYKKSSFPHGQIKVKISGESFATNDPGHKGGVYAILSVHEVNIGVIAVHLDSWSKETAKLQAEQVVRACKQAAATDLDGIAIAGDFNTRLHPGDLPVDDSSSSSSTSPIFAERVRQYSVCADTVAPVQKFAKDSEHLRGFTFFTLNGPTYCKSDTLSPNLKRDGHIDAGELDNIGFLNMSTEQPVFAFSVGEAQEATIAHPEYKDIFGRLQESSDHAAVIGVLNLTCPARLRLSNYLSENTINCDDQLTALHNFLLLEGRENALNPVLRAYFDYAIAATKQPAFQGDRSFPYHLKEIELVKTDISFIVSHLGVLGGQANQVAPYRDLIFGTCEAIEALSDNNGEFMRFIYTQLLDENIRDVNKLKAALLSPFRQWLDDHNVPRERYTLSGNESYFTVRKLGFFAGSTPNDALTPFERALLR
ncbi:MAG: endonuclease/exonuclease/phosphatase family protein [Gammaproteobacteria bacterium]|nr:endonuclease/exonuclease/phosphatase family protein [Gammaproteobacteria bacterium]